jgi:uncharacterized glyoxalase superfamily protein PhnB
VKPTPSDWPRCSSAVFYQDAAAAIKWLCDAFGFEVRLKVEGKDGRIEHSELTYGEGVVMVAQEDPDSARRWKAAMRSPRSLGGAGTQSIMFYVDDADAHCAHARSRGARIVEEPATHDYGEEHWADRRYGALDPEGHMWWITQRVRTAPVPGQR